jgi:hypothetical protein
MTDYDDYIAPGEFLMPRRFPPPWSVEESDACFISRDAKRRRSPLLLQPSEQWAGQRRFHFKE